ncbi:MAG TPA: type 1 glutamine amidotransferase [Solirubrobacteraceae bacterium]|nr:type 1 glutamine amidotransferase [Solirubrobacteraceae bacterium]
MSEHRVKGPILVLQHAGCEPPGVYEDELLARRLAFARVVLDEGGELPDWRAYAAIVVMGGGMSAGDEHEHPWLVPEKRLIGEAVHAGIPYWGVCLGAQLLAASLGADVRRGPQPELGVLPVQLTEEAASDPVFSAAPSMFAALQWHGDTYSLPAGAVRLAGSELYEQQAFVLPHPTAGGGAYGLQFHLEVDSALAEQWMQIPGYISELQALGGADAPTVMLEQVRREQARSVPLARELFGRWLELVVAPTAR